MHVYNVLHALALALLHSLKLPFFLYCETIILCIFYVYKSIDSCQGDYAFYCANDKKCIWYEWQCNGIEDCPSGDDEVNCAQPEETHRE